LKNEIVAAILVLVMIGSAGVGYLAGVGSRQTSTVTSTTTVYERYSTYSSPVSSSGLQLQIELNSTSIVYGGAVSARVSLWNTLPSNLSLTPRYSTVLSSWEGNDFLCGNSPDWGEKWALDGFALFSGHFTAANLSSVGSQLVLAPPVAIGCISRPNPNIVVMLPTSDVAVAEYSLSSLPAEVRQTLVNASTLSCAPNGRGATTCGDLNGALFGYWDPVAPMMDIQDANTNSPYFHPFTPGQYTLVAEDQWNLTAFAYFQVVAPSGYKGPATIHSGINGLGLELTASMPTTLSVGQNLSVTAELDNTTPHVLNLTSTSMVNHANGPCEQGQVTAIDIYSGSYTYVQLFNNRSQPAPLLLYDPSLSYLCPAEYTFNYLFQPNSSTATVLAFLGGHQAMRNQTEVVEETSVVAGYWAQSGSSYAFHHFSPSNYTVVVYDYWGNTDIGYFQVV
jgi:hypothetical protein